MDYLKERPREIETQKITPFKGEENNGIISCLIYSFIGCFALKYGGDFVVDSASKIAYFFHLSERVVSLSIVALGTSLPELVTSVVAVIKGDDDIAEGNILGSCIINLSFILGLGAFIANITLNIAYLENIILLLASSILIWLYAIREKKHILSKRNGTVLLIIYVIYCIRLFI